MKKFPAWIYLLFSTHYLGIIKEKVLKNSGPGGEGGIRTLDTVSRITVFETVPFNRSGTSPGRIKIRKS